ncbi:MULTISPECIES: PTS sugar transporter subunit IIC [Faecalicoccus]|uniref:Permease IIC component n=1 Tax=Faecalicoccus pleomorphus TaxID=1323 RepID=A0A3E3E434_9FIRM|nr:MULTISPECIES: PTS transporter subunit EIIC [Faecalicoccus]MDB7980999.1 PTS transporter subunit EIIC [Faecalicoccus pleomorphus]MDB7983257.1 PTS transporter subunit EIIC [Faecalicoccus pleomorphus]MDB7984457.1 PTS transporter subunit EIIC [Faecalicoccus pleomorphus]MDB7989706.1 PTS transporter subunit EIIC [Faecalicoccus pleomorphus]MDB7994187.1 PTS transporter subunit EIIC [Faecalicoccus pleomorphus]
MFDKFEAFMSKYLTPIANKMDKQRHLSAVKKAMVAMTPLLIIGSFCLIPEAIPNMIGENNPVSQWILANLDIIYVPFKVGMALMSLYVSAIIAYHLAQSYKLDVPGTLCMAVIAFLMMAVDYTEDGGISTGFLGPKGLFAAMFSSIIAVELYRWCKKKNFTIKMPDSVPDFVSRSFEMIPISVIIVGFFLIIRVVCINGLNTLPPLIFTNLFAPLVGSMDNPFAVTFLQILRCLLFFFGIHPSVLSPITSPISTQFLAENIAAVQAGGQAMHFFAPGPESAFGNFTGTGVTFGLVFWCLLSKSKAQKQIGRVALIPALFGINEPILFGAPIVLNPIFFIPYVICGGIIGTVPYWMMYFGWLKCSTFTPPYVGVFLEGYLTNFDVMSLVANGIQLVLSILVWYPFFKLYEKRELEQENKIKEEKSIFTKEDEALLNDLDLDF